jgi:hypothetical protein
MRVDGPDDDWKQIVLTVRKGSLFRKPRVMTFSHSADYYDGDDWPLQVLGMQGYFGRFPDSPRKNDILRLIGTLRFALAVPQDDLDIDSDDERLSLLYTVCQHLDGVIFTPSSLRDAQGRVLIGAGGETDPLAVLPQIPPVNIHNKVIEDVEQETVPPTPCRVAKRALALTAVAARATLEFDAPQLDDPETQRRRLIDWIESLDIGDEFEPEEWKVLQRPVGNIEQQDHLNAMWRVEGLAVLAWAIRRHELPPDDELVVPADLYQAMGIFDARTGHELLASAELGNWRRGHK